MLLSSHYCPQKLLYCLFFHVFPPYLFSSFFNRCHVYLYLRKDPKYSSYTFSRFLYRLPSDTFYCSVFMMLPFSPLLVYYHTPTTFFLFQKMRKHSNSQFAKVSYLDFLLALIFVNCLPVASISQVFRWLSIEPSLSSVVALWGWDSPLFPLPLSVVLRSR